jgi:hypothetical protein
MKKLLQILALCLLIAMLCTFVVACDGDDADPSSSSSSTPGSSDPGSSEPGPIEPPDYQDPTYGLTEDLTGKNDPSDTQ